MHRTITSQIGSIYYPILAVLGVPVNLLAIAILARGKCGLSKCVTSYLVAMATADLMVIVCNVILRWIVALYWQLSFLHYTAVCKVVLFLSSTAVDISVWMTVAFTFDRCVAICCQKLKTKYCTKKMAVVVIITLSVLFCLKNIPWPFLYIPVAVINNILRGCLLSTRFYLQSPWIEFSWIEQLLTPLLPFFLVLFFNILTVRHILIASQARRSLRDHHRGGKDQDPEMKNRRRSIILLFAISSTFILLWVTTVSYFLHCYIKNTFSYRSVINVYENFEQAGNMLQLLSCCTNTVVYMVTQRKFREELFNALHYPFGRFCK